MTIDPTRAASLLLAGCALSVLALNAAPAQSQEANEECLELIAEFYEENGINAQNTPAALRTDLRDLSTGARVLAESGNEEGCRQVLARMQGLYESRTAEGTSQTPDTAIAETRFVEAVPVGQLAHPLRAEAIIGQNVHNRMGDVVGEIADVVIAADAQGRGFALISHGGFLGMGSELTPVSWSALRYASDDEMMFLDVTAEDLGGAPTITTTDDGVPPVAEWSDQADAWWRSWQGNQGQTGGQPAAPASEPATPSQG